MKISTKRGDKGETDLLFGARVKKNCLRVSTYGAVDEFSSFLGLARAYSQGDMNDNILAIQKVLVKIMAELACLPKDLPRCKEYKISLANESDLKFLESQIEQIENKGDTFKGFRQSGDNVLQASLDVARSQCRKAERAVICLSQEEEVSEFIITYLNRLSDLLYLYSLISINK